MTALAFRRDWAHVDSSYREYQLGSPCIRFTQTDSTETSSTCFSSVNWSFDRTAIGAVTNPYEELINSAFKQVENASFLTIDEEFQEEVDQVMTKQYAEMTSKPL